MYQELAQRFIDMLQLPQPPVGLTFVEDIPENVQHVARKVASACTFWRLGEQGIFYADAEDHINCPIGMLTMGFVMPESAQQRAQELVGNMASVQYFSPAEVSALPVVKKPHQYIVYGRLDQLPIAADVVLCILDSQQAMLLAEAMGNVNWLQGGQTAFGRPTCGAVARTMLTGQASMSFGCIGARTYMDLPASALVLMLPGDQFAALVPKLETIVAANVALAPYHQQQKALFIV